MMNPNLPVLDGGLFSWKAGNGQTEASDLGLNTCWSQWVWDDACDIGFFVKSPRTGVQKLFILSFVQKDREGDIQYWVYKEHTKYGHQGTITLTVYND